MGYFTENIHFYNSALFGDEWLTKKYKYSISNDYVVIS